VVTPRRLNDRGDGATPVFSRIINSLLRTAPARLPRPLFFFRTLAGDTRTAACSTHTRHAHARSRTYTRRRMASRVIRTRARIHVWPR
jgi:hypothetical protein